jgi:beta-glucanase (GH16 family)
MKSQYRTLFIFLVLLLSVGLACNGVVAPAATATQPPLTEEPAPTEQAADSPTQQATDAPTEETADAPDFFTEEFDNGAENWSQEISLNAQDGDTNQANINLEDGRLVFDFGKWLIGYVFYDPYDYTDVRLDIRVENRGTNVNNILLVCRASEEGHYLVNIANSGLYGIYAYNGETGSYTRIADGGSTKIKAGKEFNEYGLVCKEKKLVLYINGNETRSYTDNQFVFRKGQIGVGVASEDQLPVKVELDWIKISQP